MRAQRRQASRPEGDRHLASLAVEVDPFDEELQDAGALARDQRLPDRVELSESLGCLVMIDVAAVDGGDLALLPTMNRDPRGKINSIPFVGTMLVPLIICLVLTSTWPKSGLGKAPLVTLPTAPHGHWIHEPSDPSLELTVTRDGRLWLEDGSELTSGGVERAVRLHPAERIYLRADVDAPFSSVRSLMRAVRRGGGKGLSLLVIVNG